jgi:hypothetical protein
VEPSTLFYFELAVNLTATRFYRIRQLTQERIGIFPADAGIGDALAVGQRLAASRL